MIDEDADLRDLLRTLTPPARAHLRHVLILGQSDRDAITYHLLRNRDENRTAWGNLVDRLSLDPELRKRYVRLLRELEAGG